MDVVQLERAFKTLKKKLFFKSIDMSISVSLTKILGVGGISYTFQIRMMNKIFFDRRELVLDQHTCSERLFEEVC